MESKDSHLFFLTLHGSSRGGNERIVVSVTHPSPLLIEHFGSVDSVSLGKTIELVESLRVEADNFPLSK